MPLRSLSDACARHGPLLASILLLTAIGWQGWLLVRPPANTPLTADSPAPHPATATYDLKRLQQAALFGAVDHAPVAQRPQQVKTDRKPLNLKLLGIVGADDRGAAVIGHNGRQAAYLIGDRLDLNETVVLERIADGRAYLRRGEQIEVLELPAVQDPAGYQRIDEPAQPDGDPDQGVQ